MGPAAFPYKEDFMKHLTFLFIFLFASMARADLPHTDYVLISASQTLKVLGPVGAQGDVIDHLVIVPETTSAGTVSIRDGGGSAAAYNTNVFVSGTVSDLKPINIALSARSVSGDWQVTTGANVHVIAVGRFK